MVYSEKNLKHKKKNILVVAHDAGGAEIIAAYVRRNKIRAHYLVYAAGPAKRIFARNGVSTIPAPRTLSGMRALFQRHRSADLALLGTGWMTRIEAHALKESKHAGVRTAVYLDSWKNYRERFGYPSRTWKKNLPSEIWVGDRAALLLAQRLLPVRIKFVKNEYFEDIKCRFRKARTGKPSEILFFSVPDPVSESVLSILLYYIARLPQKLCIRIRLHPADKQARYKHLFKSYIRNLVISREKDLAKDIARAHIAIGAETTALALAGMLGVSSITVSSKKVELPFPNMERVATARSGVHLLEKKSRNLGSIHRYVRVV